MSVATKRILVVEDDQYIRDLYAEVLTEAGFKVETAADGEEGAVKAQKGGYNLILLDVMMPKLDGLGFLAELKRKPAKERNGPIVLLTNLAHDKVVKEGLEKGAKDYIVKVDITPDELVRKAKGFFI